MWRTQRGNSQDIVRPKIVLTASLYHVFKDAHTYAGDLMAEIDAEIEELFDTLPKESGAWCENPVTGGHFVRAAGGKNSIAYQKKEARKALEARERFASVGPQDARPLPVNHAEREALKARGGVYKLLALFGRSLEGCDYYLDRHPSFERYARGVLASPFNAHDDLQDPKLKRRFSPYELPGLGPGLYWRSLAPASHRGQRKTRTQSLKRRVSRCHS